MAMEWPDYENELKKKDKAKKARKRTHDDFIVEDSDDNKLRNAHYRADKRKQHGKPFVRVQGVFRVLKCLFTVGLLFQVEVNTLFPTSKYLLTHSLHAVLPYCSR